MKNLTTLFFIILSYTAHADSQTITPQQLDQFIINTCSVLSPKEKCFQKMSDIRKGLTTSDLLKQAPALKIDSTIETTVIKDPSHFISNYYCLAIYNEVVTIDQVPADIFPYVVYGFSFSTASLKSYSKWLTTQSALPCINSLKAQGLKPLSITSDKQSNIILNPVTFLENGTDEAFLDTAIRNYNHERLHAIYALEKAKIKVSKLWKSLTKGEQEQFTSEHLNYNFKNTDTLFREFFSFTFEQNPEAAYDFLSRKLSYNQIKQSTCKSCLAYNLNLKNKVKDMARLSPKDLIKKIEDEKIKILILSSGRKTSSKLFTWGQIRLDSGELNQISATEGAMGKTLCLGEKPEAQDSITIVLASDSPYSTLIHEYIHALQIKEDISWCPVSKRLWVEKPSSAEIRMIRDREWDVRLVLWELLDSPMMNVEDQIIVAEGILRESQARKKFDPSAFVFLNDHKVQLFLEKKIEEYKKTISQ